MKIEANEELFKWTEDKNLKEIVSVLKEWRYVGGCVRDSLCNGLQTNDIDIVTTMSPTEVEALYKDKYTYSNIGARFGTIAVYYRNWNIEITTVRKDGKGRHPDVEYLSSNNIEELMEEDAKRRDFTINALSYKDGYVYDYFEGIEHLRSGKLIFVREAKERIEEDPLRMIRYIRFYCRFSNKDQYYEDLFIEKSKDLRTLSIERVISEIQKLMSHKDSSKGIELMNKYRFSLEVFGLNLNKDYIDNIPTSIKEAIIYSNITDTNILRGIKKETRRILTTEASINNLLRLTIKDKWYSYVYGYYLYQKTKWLGYLRFYLGNWEQLNWIPIKERRIKEYEYRYKDYKYEFIW